MEAAAESQQSQASLFTSGSEPASSMELFSEPAYSSSLSSTSQQQTQHSQNEAPSHFSANTLNGKLSSTLGELLRCAQMGRVRARMKGEGYKTFN